jgi:hypothetical protein
MTSRGRISLSANSAIEMVAGAALMLLALPLSLTPTGVVVAVAIGATLVGLGLSSAGTGEGRPPVPVLALAAYHHWAGIAMLVSGSLLGLAGDVAALTILVPLGLLQLALVQATRYVPTPA